MNAVQTRNRDFEAMAWGALFIWWGVTVLVKFLPNGSGLVGIGLILIGLNIARWLSGIPVSAFSSTLGVLALVWGGLELAGALLALPFELPVLAILLMTLGVILLGREILRPKGQ